LIFHSHAAARWLFGHAYSSYEISDVSFVPMD